jgi:hypothetical protein
LNAADDKEAKSLIQNVKTLFRYETPKEFEEVDIQLWSIYGMLGLQGLMRVIFDSAIA